MRRFASAEVAQSPSCVPEHAQFVVFTQKSKQRAQRALLENVISALWAIPGNVTECPDSLLPDIVDRRGQQLNELWNSASVDDSLSMLSGARSNVRERPCCLELLVDESNYGRLHIFRVYRRT